MTNLDSGAGKDFVERSLDGRRVGEESFVEIQHSQEASDLAENFGRGTALKIGYAFGESLGTVG
jgi:hypothetical protein